VVIVIVGTVTVTVTELHCSTELFSEESCSVIGLSKKMGFQLRSELSATVVRWEAEADGNVVVVV